MLSSGQGWGVEQEHARARIFREQEQATKWWRGAKCSKISPKEQLFSEHALKGRSLLFCSLLFRSFARESSAWNVETKMANGQKIVNETRINKIKSFKQVLEPELASFSRSRAWSGAEDFSGTGATFVAASQPWKKRKTWNFESQSTALMFSLLSVEIRLEQ